MLVPEDLGTVVVVLHGVLHKAEAVDVTNIRVSVGPKEVEATDGLLPDGGNGECSGGRRKTSTAVVAVTLTLNAKQTFRATSFSMADSMTG